MAGQQVESIPVTITGRIVGSSLTQESLMKGGDKRVYKKGVPPDKRELVMESGKPVREWYYRIAVSKTGLDALGNPNGLGDLYNAIIKQATMFKPKGFQPDPSGASMSDPKDYSLKYKDGDIGKSEDGEPYSKYDFNKNVYLFEVSNRYAPKWLTRGDDGLLVHAQEGDIKVGDHVAVSLLVGAGDSGVYLNLMSTLLLKSGDRIGGDVGPKPEEAFAMFTKPTQGPTAAVGSFGQQAPAQQPAFQQPAAQPAFMQQAQAPAPQPPAPPHTGVLPPQFQQQVAQPAPGGNPFQFPGTPQGTPQQ